MATIQPWEPQYVGNPDFSAPLQVPVLVAPGAAWRRGDFIVSQTVGTILTPAPTGSMAATAGPALAAVTVGSSASAGAPGGTYYCTVTYTATSNESLPSLEFPINVLPGFVPTVSVAAAGAPAAATNFAAYMALTPGYEALQQATRTTTALGATFTAANPLTNSVGMARAATNAATLAGMAVNDSNENFYGGPGGSSNIGNQSLMGATMNQSPLTPNEAQLAYVMKLTGGAIVEINLRLNVANTWTPILAAQGAQVGLFYDPSGFPTADVGQANKVATILQGSDGVPSVVGTNGDIGKRVQIQFLTSATV